MAIRFKKYRHTIDGTYEVKALQITEANIPDLVNHICRHGGAVTGHLYIPPVKIGKIEKKARKARIRIRQRNFGEHWGKLDWRVATVGDYILRHEINGKYEFERVKGGDFESLTDLVK